MYQISYIYNRYRESERKMTMWTIFFWGIVRACNYVLWHLAGKSAKLGVVLQELAILLIVNQIGAVWSCVLQKKFKKVAKKV